MEKPVGLQREDFWRESPLSVKLQKSGSSARKNKKFDNFNPEVVPAKNEEEPRSEVKSEKRSTSLQLENANFVKTANVINGILLPGNLDMPLSP